ncbi:MAG: acyl-CoA dehydrogenase family protein [Gemmatales bacterium]
MNNDRGAAVLDEPKASFAETALKLGGKSEDEARRTGAIDRADDQVEQLFAAKFQTTASPAHRAVWDQGVPVELFTSSDPIVPGDAKKVMDRSVDIIRTHRDKKTLLDKENKVSASVLEELGGAGYWGLLVDKQYGGSGVPFASFAPFLTRMAMYDATVSGLASVHGCIGAVDPLRTFGTPEQKQRFLPDLATGKRLSAFALTEPGAGSDLTALKTTARLEGDHYLVTGEKLFITNVVPGRTIGLVCLIDKKPAVLIVDLPKQENESFQIRKYGLHALKHTHNQGMIFKDMKVPAENLLKPTKGDGLTIAYHGLNLGRVALCAGAAGNMRSMMAGMLPWSRYRITYGQPIASRELLQRRVGRLAGMIVASDALVAWCAGLIDQGYRGEMECIIAKIFGSETQKEAAIELCMKSHGGRSFLHGHHFGDNVHEFLAPCIYEGEGEMLGMAFFKSLVKAHGTQFFEPIGQTLAKLGVRKPSFANPAHLWALKGPLWEYSKWMMAQKMSGKTKAPLPTMNEALRGHAEYAVNWLNKAGVDISAAMRTHQLALADRQCRMSELSQRVQDAITILCTALYGGRQTDVVLQTAADIGCQDLTRRLTGARPSDRYFKNVTKLGKEIIYGGWKSFIDAEMEEILMPYESK